MCGSVIAKTKARDVPHLPRLLQVILGIVNIFAFGVGVIIAGILNCDLSDIIIGILQLVIPIVGWIWAVYWGVLMVIRT